MPAVTAIFAASLLAGPPASATWNFETVIESSGQDISWSSPSAIVADGGGYESTYVITEAYAWVTYLGIEFGPIDVYDDIPPENIHTYQSEAGPSAVNFCTMHVVYPDPPEPEGLSWYWHTSVDSKGVGHYDLTDPYLGQVDYDLGWPWGTVTVQVTKGRLVADLTMEAVGEWCPADINGDNSVDVADLLLTLSDWGWAGDGCYMTDINDDEWVNVQDLLAVIASWGQCPP